MKKLKQLESLASELVGDGKSPNLYFVSQGGVIVGILRNFQKAYDLWLSYAWDHSQESALEDRLFGVIASVAPESDEPGARLVRIDDSPTFCRFHPSAATA